MKRGGADRAPHNFTEPSTAHPFEKGNRVCDAGTYDRLKAFFRKRKLKMPEQYSKSTAPDAINPQYPLPKRPATWASDRKKWK